MTDCQIVEEDYRKILRCVRDYFEELQEQGAGCVLLSQTAAYGVSAASCGAQGIEDRGDSGSAGDHESGARAAGDRRDRKRDSGRIAGAASGSAS